MFQPDKCGLFLLDPRWSASYASLRMDDAIITEIVKEAGGGKTAGYRKFSPQYHRIPQQEEDM